MSEPTTTTTAPVQTPPDSTPPPAAAPNSAPPSWTSGLSEDLRGFVELKGFKDPANVVEAYKNFEKMKGIPQERLLALPEKADSPEWNAVYERLGKPAKKEDYKFPGFIGEDKEFSEWARDMFHGANVTTKQAETIASKWDEFSKAAIAKQQEMYQQKVTLEVEGLKKEWGAAYGQQVETAKQAAKAFNIDGETVDKMESVMGHSKVMKLLADIGSKIGEDSFISGGQSSGFKVLTPAAAKAKIEMLQSDKAWGKKYVEGDAQARQEFEHLHKLAYGQT